jgi:translation initiation factor 2B subunit (eIF-2B alpha/beta/delta family)
LNEINKTVKDLKVEIEETKKTQTEEILGIENIGKRTETTMVSITNRIQWMEKRISGLEDTVEEIDISVKENAKSKRFLIQNIQEIWDTMKTPNLRIIGIEEGKES